VENQTAPQKVMKKIHKHEREIISWLNNYESNLHNHQKFQNLRAFEAAGYEKQGRRHC
jgi:hypothetical protein